MGNSLKKVKTFIIVFFCSLFVISNTAFTQSHTGWSYNLVVYEVNVRQYTKEGTFSAFESHMERLKELGVGILWFMPINPIGIKNRLGSLGSYYSVKDYIDINPEFGTLDDFKRLVNKAHEMGFYVIIDWVANHTSWDNNLTVTNPEWYTKDGSGNFVPPAGTNWTDVIDLNYDQAGLRAYMTDAMKFWITETDIDGFRCDAASMVPLDFWSETISELKSVKPEILMLAEANGKEFHTAGFDMTFAWNLYGFGDGVLIKIVEGTYNANFLASLLRAELSDYLPSQGRLYFTSNHDENSWEGTVFERFGAAAEPFAVITQTMNGTPLIYSGQEAGLNKRLQFFDKDQITWKENRFDTVYTLLAKLRKENKALWSYTAENRAQRVLTNNNPEVFAFLRRIGNDKLFAIFNLSNNPQSIIPEGELFADNYFDVFSNDALSLSSGSQISLDPWGYKVFSTVPTTTGVNDEAEIPARFILEQNYPNPFNPSTKIRYSIPLGDNSKANFVQLKTYDTLGKEMETLVEKHQASGNYEVEWKAKDRPSGIYFYELRFGNNRMIKKMTLLK